MLARLLPWNGEEFKEDFTANLLEQYRTSVLRTCLSHHIKFRFILMKSKSLILLVLSIGFGIVAAIGISQVMNSKVDGATTATPMGAVLVATGPLDLKAVLTEENVKIESWPTSIIPPDAVSNIEEITDMVTMTRMSQGMPIVRGAIQHRNTLIKPTIPPNMKVFAIRVAADDTFGNLLEPGNKVDVIGIFKRRDRKNNQTTTTSRTFLKALQVYSIGNKTTIDTSEKSANQSRTSIVGLIVTEKQSEALVFVQDTGSIKLVLRGDDVENNGEVEQFEEIKSVALKQEDDLLEAKTQMRTPPMTKTEMIIWQGSESRTIEFDNNGSRVNKETNHDGSSNRETNNDGSTKKENIIDDVDFNDRGDSERGISDDQYPGE